MSANYELLTASGSHTLTLKVYFPISILMNAKTVLFVGSRQMKNKSNCFRRAPEPSNMTRFPLVSMTDFACRFLTLILPISEFLSQR